MRELQLQRDSAAHLLLQQHSDVKWIFKACARICRTRRTHIGLKVEVPAAYHSPRRAVETFEAIAALILNRRAAYASPAHNTIEGRARRRARHDYRVLSTGHMRHWLRERDGGRVGPCLQGSVD